MDQVTVTHGDQTITVPIDKLTLPEGYNLLAPGQAPDGFMPSNTFQAELDRRSKGLKKPDDLLGDDDFFKRAASKRGIDLGEDLKPVGKLDPEKVKQLQDAWKAEHLQPILQERDTLKEKADKARRRVLMADIMQASEETGVKRDRLKSIFGDGPSEFVKELASRAQWDDDKEAWFFSDSMGNPMYADLPQNGNPYAGPKKMLEALRKGDKEFVYFDDKRPGSSGFDKNGSTIGLKTMARAQFDALHESQKPAFFKGGGQVVD